VDNNASEAAADRRAVAAQLEATDAQAADLSAAGGEFEEWERPSTSP
jgi:hypothetical protein